MVKPTRTRKPIRPDEVRRLLRNIRADIEELASIQGELAASFSDAADVINAPYNEGGVAYELLRDIDRFLAEHE